MTRRQLSDQSNIGSPGRESIHHRKRLLSTSARRDNSSSSPRDFLPTTTSSTCRPTAPSSSKRFPFSTFVHASLRIWLCLIQSFRLRKTKRLSSFVGLVLLLSIQLRQRPFFFDVSLTPDADILLPSYRLPSSRNMTQSTVYSIQSPKAMPLLHASSSHRPDYETIPYQRIMMGSSHMQPRYTNSHDDAHYHNYRAHLLEQMNSKEMALQSEQERAIWNDPSRYEHYDDLVTMYSNSTCRRPKWSFATHLNCNSLHEVLLPQLESPTRLQQYAIKYLSEGSFRMAWLLQELSTTKLSYNNDLGIVDTSDTIVMKNLRFALEWNALTMKQVHFEALVMSQTLDSPATADIYGHCGTSILVETGQSIRNSVFYSQNLVKAETIRRQQIKLAGTKSLNKLTDEQRLKLALRMAESLAAMHGNVNGVIVNDDLQVFQWVVCKDGNIKLNDFNNAIIMEWDDKRQDYCKFTGEFESVYRSPQENTGEPTDESADVHVLGTMYYNLLTGLMPFYDRRTYSDAVKALVEKREMPYIDPAFRNGTLVEQALVRIMEDCWHYESKGRPSVFSVLKKLRKTVTAFEGAHPGVSIEAVDLRPLGRPL